MTSSTHGLQLIHRITDAARFPAHGITKSSLWDAWKAVRKEIRTASIRDVIDLLDYDVGSGRMDRCASCPAIERHLRACTAS